MELTIALAKGRLAKLVIELFSKCGIDTSELRKIRKLVVCDKKRIALRAG